jgi:transmembrane sensor
MSNVPDNNPHDNIVRLPDTDDLRYEAASWVTVLGRDQVTDEEWANFKAWLAVSERHKQAFEALSRLNVDFGILKELDVIAEATEEILPAATRFLPRRIGLALAAGLAGILVAGSVYLANYANSAPQTADYDTTVGELRQVTLSDGSSIQLNTNSHVEVRFSSSERRVYLTRGEAYFSVAHNPRRPFSVYAANGVVTAVGTAFTVRLREQDAVEVTVEKGRVALSARPEPTPNAVRSFTAPAPNVDNASVAQLSSNQTTVFKERVEEIEQMPQPKVVRKLAWRQGILVYSGEPLSEVIADISRYTDIKIEVADPALLNRPVAGYFGINEVNGSIESLASSFKLKVERIDATRIRLSTAS